MKKICFVLVSVMLLLSGATAKAQYGNGKRFINTAEVVYSPVTLSGQLLGIDLVYRMNAVSLDWTQAYGFWESTPLYLQYGGVIQYSWGAAAYTGEPMHLLSLNIPISLAYDLTIPKTNISVVPYAGLNFQEHVLGLSGKTDLFDKEDMAGYPFEDFMISWLAGAKFVFDRYIIGVAYQGPFTGLLWEDEAELKLSQVNFSLGIRFQHILMHHIK